MSSFRMNDIGTLLDSHGLGARKQVQKYVDNAVLRLSDPYIPKDTGTLARSGTVHTVIGSGNVEYATPYCRSVYYGNSGHGRDGTAFGGLRGKLWFERMKSDKKDEILKGAKAYAGNLER